MRDADRAMRGFVRQSFLSTEEGLEFSVWCFGVCVCGLFCFSVH